MQFQNHYEDLRNDYLRMFDYDIPVARIFYEGNDRYVLYLLLYICLALISYEFLVNKGPKGYKEILNSSGRLVSDFTLISTKPLVLFNIGIIGLINVAYVKLCRGVLNGPIVEGINLCNNGLSGGIVAGIIVPLLKNFNEWYKRD